VIELTSSLQFPEGPIASEDGSVLVVEIANGRLTRCSQDGLLTTIAQRDPNGGLFPHGRSTTYGGGSIQRVDLATGSVETLYDRVGDEPLSAPNDIVFDEAGGFWFTDLGHMAERSIERGRVCYATADGSSIRTAVFPMLTPNGIGLSPDGRTLYVAETVTARVWAFDVVAPGQLALAGWPSLSPGRLLYSAGGYCSFDSLALEANGNVCVATLGTGGVTVISPAGDLVEFVKFPDRATTNLCFGGSGLQTAFVTQSRSGRLLAVPWARRGLAPHFSGLSKTLPETSL
jgi:gluconolactonase